MKFLVPLLVVFALVSCSGNEKSNPTKRPSSLHTFPKKENIEEFQSILDSANLTGSILIYSLSDSIYYSNDFEWAEVGRLPASTFKITNSIIALETGVVRDDSALFVWDGKPRRLKVWEQDLVFRDAFHKSCVPCYQEIARAIGTKRMNEYLSKLDYGDMVVADTNIDVFWLEGDSKISQMQQISFLTRFYNNDLPISERTAKLMKRLMVIDETERYRISGKTGWSIRNVHNNGWFVGYLEQEGQVFFFAVNVDPNESFNMDLFPKIRSEVAMRAFEVLEIL